MKKLPAYFYLLVLVAVFRFAWLDFAELQSWDETIHASWGRVIAEKGIWLDLSEYPVWDYQSFRYPPLHVWSMALSFRALGVSELAARLPSAIAGALLVWFAFRFGRRAGGTAAGIWTALLVGCNYLLVHFSRYAMTEIVYLLFLFVAFAFFWGRIRSGRREATLIAGAAFGCALMTKGVVALMYPAAGALFAALLFVRDREASRTAAGSLVLSSLFGFVLAVPWHVAMYSLHGMNFVNEAFLLNVVERVVSGVENQQKSLGPLYYLNQLPIRIPFTFMLFAGGAATVLLSMRPGRARASRADSPELLFLCWFLVALGMFSFAESKQVQYTPPIVLPALVLAGLFAGALWNSNRWRGAGYLLVVTPLILGWAGITPVRLAVKRVVGSALRVRLPDAADIGIVAAYVVGLGLATLALFVLARRFARGRAPALSPRRLLSGVGVLAFAFALYRSFVFEPSAYLSGAVEATRHLRDADFARVAVLSAWMDPPLIYYLGVPTGAEQRERFALVQPDDLGPWLAGPESGRASHIVVDRPDFREVDRWGREFYGDELAGVHEELGRDGWQRDLENSHYEIWSRTRP